MFFTTSTVRKIANTQLIVALRKKGLFASPTLNTIQRGLNSSYRTPPPTQNTLRQYFKTAGRMVSECEVAVKYLEGPDKSDYDKKLYKCLMLPNGMHALLVSDPSPKPHSGLTSSSSSSSSSADSNEATEGESTTSTEDTTDSTASNGTESSSDSDEGDEKLAALALLVDVGSFSEPLDYQGLAHFLEHMIFMGSEKYPTENAFDAHIKKCGGFDNAQTDAEETIFFFEVSEEHLDSSMDYFSALLKAPLMLKEAMTRERDSIESEFQQVLNDDEARRDQILATLATEGYPHGTFAWGNLVSLKRDTPDGDDQLYERVHEFCREHYSAHRMYLCVQARLPIDELESLVIKHFADIPSNGKSGLDISAYDFRNAFVPDFHKQVYFIKPVQNVCKIDFTWVLPPMLKYYRCKPDHFLANLLGFEGEGSLCAYLRNKLWGLVVIAGINEAGFDDNNIFSLFNICLHLTDEGFHHLDDVLKATFAYVKLFAQPSSVEALKSLYEEQQKIEAINFRYAPERAAYDNVQQLVLSSRNYNSKDILTGNTIYFEYNAEQIQEMIALLNEFKFNIMIVSQQPYKGFTSYDKYEKWFGTEYTTIPMPQRWAEMWENSEPMKELHLPPPNQFITNDFRIFYNENGKPELPQFPQRIVKNDVCELWFKVDDKFLLPEANMQFYFISPLPRQSAKNDVMCSLLTLLIKHNVSVKLYPAVVAGLHFHLYAVDRGLVMKVYGFNEKLDKLVRMITETLIQMKDLISSEQLTAYKTQQKKILFNGLIKPHNLNKDIRLSIVEHVHWPLITRYKVLDSVTIEDMLEFAEKFPQELYIQSLIQGNITQDAAVEIMNSTLSILNCKKIENTVFTENRTVQLPQGSHYIRCHGLYEKDVNTLITNFYQIGPISIRLESTLDLLMMFVEEPLFDNLRTKEQLGYHVGSTVRSNFGIIGYSITVNSQENKHPAHHIDERIEAFRNKMMVILDEMETEEFEHVLNSLIKLKQVVDMSLEEEASRNWLEIISEDYLFDRRRREIEVLRTLSKQDLINFCFNNERTNFRKLSIQVIGNTAHLKNQSNGGQNDAQSEQGKNPAAGEQEGGDPATNVDLQQSNEDGLFQSLGKTLDLKFIPRDGDATTITDIDEFKENLHVYPITRIKLDDSPLNDGQQLPATVK